MSRALQNPRSRAGIWPALLLWIAVCAATPAWTQDTEIEIAPGDVRARIGDTEATISLQVSECTGIELAADRPSLPFGDRGFVRWAFSPAGCEPPTLEKSVISFSAVPKETLGMGMFFTDFHSSSVRQVDDPTPLPYYAEAPGIGHIQAAFGALTGTVAIAVADRPRCTGMQVSVASDKVPVGGVVELRTPYVDRLGLENGTLGAALTPEGCSVGRNTPFAIVALDRPDLAQRNGNDIRGIAPGSVGVVVALAGLTATAQFTVVPPPPCNTLTYHVPSMIVGEVTGVAYRGGLYLRYRNDQAAQGHEEICTKPAGAPHFEAVNRHASVDRTTGVVTGVSQGRARIGALHGDLIGIAEFSVTEQTEPCDGMRLSYLPFLQFRGTARPSVSYEPFGCDPPPGLASFSAEPIGPVLVSLDGSIMGSAPGGKARVTMRHGPFTAISADIEVAQLRPCTTLTGSFEPPEISASRPSTLSLAYGPVPCAMPKEYTQVTPMPSLDIEPQDDRTWKMKVGHYWELAAKNEENTVWDDQVFRVFVYHGSLSTVVQLPTGAKELCEFKGVRIEPTTIRPGETARIEVGANFDWCVPPKYVLADSGARDAVSFENAGGGFVARGLHGGVVYLTVGNSPIRKLTVVAPPCASLKLDYRPRVLKRREFGLAVIDYSPEGCTRPEGTAEFESSASSTIGVVRHGGKPAGTVQARDWDAQSYGNARITMRHGNLTAEAVVGVRRD